MDGQEQGNTVADIVARRLESLVGLVNEWRARGVVDVGPRPSIMIRQAQEALQDFWNLPQPDEDTTKEAKDRIESFISSLEFRHLQILVSMLVDFLGSTSSGRKTPTASLATVNVKVDTSDILKMLDATERYLDLVFLDGMLDEYTFVEVESPAGTGVKVGRWIDRGDGYRALRLTLADFLSPESATKREEPEEVRSKYPCPKCHKSVVPPHLGSPFAYRCPACGEESGAREWLMSKGKMRRNTESGRKTKIDVSLASSSGSRFCFVCEEKILHRTVVLDFHTTDESGDVFRSSPQLACHPECAAELNGKLRLVLLETGHVKLDD